MVRCGTKENPSDLGTKVLEREAMASCMSKLAIVPASTLRGAIVAALARATSASDEVIVDGCCSKRVGNTTTGVVNTADSGLIRGERWGRRSCRGYEQHWDAQGGEYWIRTAMKRPRTEEHEFERSRMQGKERKRGQRRQC